MTTPLDERVAGIIRRRGPIPADEVVELALYDAEHGFYAGGGGRAGRADADFITSAEIGPLFGAVVARAIDATWERLGRPDPFVVIECGAGPGTLARTVLAASPACAPALRYLLVERSDAQRALHGDHLPLEDAAFAWPPADPDEEGEPTAGPAEGPIAVSLSDLPAIRVPGVVLANELLDNLPFRILERGPTGWLEVLVGLTGDDLPFSEHSVPARGDLAATAERLVPDAAVGARIPLQQLAVDWLRAALDLLTAGDVIVFDYAATTAAMAGGEWVRTYRGHAPGRGWLDELGTQDITCLVATDQLARLRPLDADTPQADWLKAHGIDDLVAEGNRIWQERAHLGDLEAVRARSRATERDALCDAEGLGAFRVLEWHV